MVSPPPRALWEISKRALIANVKEISRYAGKKVIAVVKANAYGHGIKTVVPILETLPEVEFFAVSTPREGIQLRKTLGVKKPILLLSGFLPEEFETLKEYRLIPVVSDRYQLRKVITRRVPYHLNLDTGMGRLGFRKLPPLELLKRFPPQGVMTHFPSADVDPVYTLKQIGLFRKLIKPLRVKYVHAQNTAGLFYKVPFANLVRVGLGIYGEYGSKRLKETSLKLTFPSVVKARIIGVRRLPKGCCISYGCRYKLKRTSWVGIIAFGYADGLDRRLFNRLKVFYRSRTYPVVGNITMDLTAIDFGNDKPSVGDWVQIINSERTFSDVADLLGTIPYEIMTSIGSRVERKLVE